ncbi:GNAT family N-acetyltransferase [Streptomyces sp. NPDC057702]|uniref:GNAT family N-acetyltransferase n=1 Tax=unclassified Streptomyces TaxID=2593676 RepID=UPI0036A277BC
MTDRHHVERAERAPDPEIPHRPAAAPHHPGDARRPMGSPHRPAARDVAPPWGTGLRYAVVEVPWTHPDAVALRARQRAEIAEMYGTADSEPGIPPSAADSAVFVVAYAAREAHGAGEAREVYGEAGSGVGCGEPVGCGGLRDLGGGVGELKRMYVEPGWRGTGVAEAVLVALEEWARRRGWRGLRLETGDRQPAAVRFYARCGYERIPNFGAYVGVPGSWCFGRELT